MVKNHDDEKELHCSFCGKSQNEVKKLIAGPTAFICNECIELGMEKNLLSIKPTAKNRHPKKL